MDFAIQGATLIRSASGDVNLVTTLDFPVQLNTARANITAGRDVVVNLGIASTSSDGDMRIVSSQPVTIQAARDLAFNISDIDASASTATLNLSAGRDLSLRNDNNSNGDIQVLASSLNVSAANNLDWRSDRALTVRTDGDLNLHAGNDLVALSGALTTTSGASLTLESLNAAVNIVADSGDILLQANNTQALIRGASTSVNASLGDLTMATVGSVDMTVGSNLPGASAQLAAGQNLLINLGSAFNTGNANLFLPCRSKTSSAFTSGSTTTTMAPVPPEFTAWA